MNEAIGRCVRLLSDPMTPAKALVLFGAGAAHSQGYPLEKRLPLGNQIKDSLLEAAYPDAPLEEREDLFRTDYHWSAVTPDVVWTELVSGKASLDRFLPRLAKLFSDDIPTPPAYYRLARWFFTAPNAGSLVTTNYDMHLDRAVAAVGHGLGKRQGSDFFIPSVDDDFEFMIDTNTNKKLLIQKIHGSLDKPWSIVAGTPDPRAQDPSDSAHGRSAPPPNGDGPTTRPSYASLRASLVESSVWVFMGYSFKDVHVKNTVLDAWRSRTPEHVFLIDIAPPNWLRDEFASTVKRGRRANATVVSVESTADEFMTALLSSYAKDASPAGRSSYVRIPLRERDLLNNGPVHVPGWHGRHSSTGTGPFADQVYGTYDFSEDVRSNLFKIVDCGELQRLRWIKQLSFVYQKHPGATHDRFTHSLGVTHLADRLFAHIRANIGNVPATWQGEEVGDGFRVQVQRRETHLAFLVAALLHDIGHGPLGHTMDLVRQRLERQDTHEQDSSRAFEAAMWSTSVGDLEVPLRSVPVDRTLVQKILTNEHPLGLALANPGVDLDRLDFLLRDGFATFGSLVGPAAAIQFAENVSSTEADAERERTAGLVKSVAAGLDSVLASMLWVHDEEAGNQGFGLDQRVRSKVEAIARLYAHMYENVYHCWQNSASQSMIAMALEEVFRTGRFTWDEVIALTDVELFAALEQFESAVVRELALLVKYRRLLRYAGEYRFTGDGTLRWDAFSRFMRQNGFSVSAGGSSPTHHATTTLVCANIVKPKVFKVRFAEFPEQTSMYSDGPKPTLLEPVNLATTDGRVMLFSWPGQPVDFSALEGGLRDLCTVSGLSLLPGFRPHSPV
jgi:HD superfamily phosphohydrolase